MLGTPGDAATVRPAKTAAGRVSVPGDKSISHRYAILAALAEGPSIIRGYSPGADCAATLGCLAGLGVQIEHRGDVVEVRGKGPGKLSPPTAPLDAANSGTTMRLLSGVVAGHRFRTVLEGDPSLSRRPMRRVIDPLSQMGATIDSNAGRPPLVIDGADLHGITHAPAVPSAQVKSAVLLAGLHAVGTTTVIEPAPTRDHTERAMRTFGVEVTVTARTITIRGGQRPRPVELSVPGDLSSATFWIALAAAMPQADIQIDDVGLNPSRMAVIDMFRRAGVRIDVTTGADDGVEPRGTIRARHGSLRSFAIAPEEVPSVIDEIPALVSIGALLPRGETMRVEGAAELRVKESDRIACLAAGLRALGADVDEFDDGLIVQARPLSGGVADAAGDHRIAMSLAIAAAGSSSPSTIVGASSVAVSYPSFFEELSRLTSNGGGR